MTSDEYVCRHCGSDDIVAELSYHGSMTYGGKIRARNGKPDMDTWGADLDVYDYDVEGYTCECGKDASKLEDLVIKRSAFDQLKQPCGRCDHATTAHQLLTKDITAEEHRRGLLRAAMPCTVESCDCHDYYDPMVALSPAAAPEQMEIAA